MRLALLVVEMIWRGLSFRMFYLEYPNNLEKHMKSCLLKQEVTLVSKSVAGNSYTVMGWEWRSCIGTHKWSSEQSPSPFKLVMSLIIWVVPPPINSGKWRFLGSPTKNVIILVVTGILGRGTTQLIITRVFDEGIPLWSLVKDHELLRVFRRNCHSLQGAGVVTSTSHLHFRPQIISESWCHFFRRSLKLLELFLLFFSFDSK